MSNKKLPMTKCKRRLATLWFCVSGVLFLCMFLQTMLRNYRGKASEAWSWLLPTLMPTLSLILGVLIMDALGKSERKMVDGFLFWLTFSISGAYLLIVTLTLVLLTPWTVQAALDHMKQSHLYLGPLQGLVGASLGAFFVKKETG